MKKQEKNRYGYSAISIKADVAVRFRRYSKQFSRPNSEVLQRMMFFLQWNGLDPFGSGVEKIVSEIRKNRKQIEYLISITKNMEKLHIKPTYEMVKILFEAHCKSKGAVRKEKLFLPQPELEEVKQTVPRASHVRLQQEYSDYRKGCAYLLGKIETVEPTFGKPYLKVDLSPGDYENLRRELNRQ